MSNNRHSVIREEEGTFVVDLFEDNRLVESRRLEGRSIHYAEDVSRNWDSGLIQFLRD